MKGKSLLFDEEAFMKRCADKIPNSNFIKPDEDETPPYFLNNLKEITNGKLQQNLLQIFKIIK